MLVGIDVYDILNYASYERRTVGRILEALVVIHVLCSCRNYYLLWSRMLDCSTGVS